MDLYKVHKAEKFLSLYPNYVKKNKMIINSSFIKLQQYHALLNIGSVELQRLEEETIIENERIKSQKKWEREKEMLIIKDRYNYFIQHEDEDKEQRSRIKQRVKQGWHLLVCEPIPDEEAISYVSIELDVQNKKKVCFHLINSYPVYCELSSDLINLPIGSKLDIKRLMMCTYRKYGSPDELTISSMTDIEQQWYDLEQELRSSDDINSYNQAKNRHNIR